MPDDKPPHDPLPGMIAEIDQALEMIGQQARVTKAAFDAYIEEGFNEKQALYLAASFFKTPDTPE
jgi:hypothetical protein